MPAEADRQRRIWQAARSARCACLCFGIGLLAWGLAPAVIARVVTGLAPPAQALAASTVVFGLGMGFVVLGVLIGRGVAWALWAALVVSLVVIAGNVGFALTHRDAMLSAFGLVLPAATAGTSWLALDARRSGRRAKGMPGA